METQQLTFRQTLKGGAIAGLIAAGLNNIWTLIAGGLGATIPAGFFFAVTASSIFSLLIGSVIFFLIIKFLPIGNLFWLVLTIGFTLISFYPVFNPPVQQDGTIPDSTFPLLAGPLHAISGVLAAWGIPKWAK